MKIANLRLGFATNSSSSHSIIITNEKYSDDSPTDGKFGWKNFVLSTPSSKMSYLASMVKTELSQHIDEDMAQLASAALFSVPVGNVGYVNHQSCYDLPMISQYGKVGINIEFVRDLAQFLQRSNIVITGGNNIDPSERMQDIYGSGKEFTSLDRIKDNGYNLRARKDGKFWTLFNTVTGAKITFSFDDNAIPSKKAFLPELVDVAITHQCSGNCSYCYTDATPNGRIAPFGEVHSLLYQLSNARVFEVALGGGDVISYPYLVNVLQLCRDLDIIPNITCKGMEWMVDGQKILSLIGQVGVSGEDPSRLHSFMNIYPQVKLSAHYIMGTYSLDNLRYRLTEASKYNVPVVLLGFKKVGRGRSYQYLSDYSTWGDIVLSLGNRCPTLSIDTLLAQQYPEQTVKVAQSDILYKTIDGINSMYVDLVDRYVAPSSWCDESEHIKLDENNRNLFTGWSGKSKIDFNWHQDISPVWGG